MSASASDESSGEHAALKDMAGGALLIAGGGAVMVAALNYGIGTLTEMGAGYFPALVGAVLLGIGVLMLAQSAWRFMRERRAPAARFAVVTEPADARAQRMARVRGMVCIMGGLVAFIVLGAYGGLLPASFAVVFISALGDRDNTLRGAFLIALAMTAISVVVFWWALQLQMPLLRFFG
jgi:hypothetical protein